MRVLVAGREVVRAAGRDGRDAADDRRRGNRAAAARRRARGPAGASGTIAPCFPRLAAGADGNVWLAFRGKPGGNWRVQVGSVWFEYVTRLYGDEWTEAVWLPRSNNILDNRPALCAAGGRR